VAGTVAVVYLSAGRGTIWSARLELAGEPRRIRSNFTNGLKSLPLRIVPR
jgi:hypothetical protein